MVSILFWFLSFHIFTKALCYQPKKSRGRLRCSTIYLFVATVAFQYQQRSWGTHICQVTQLKDGQLLISHVSGGYGKK